MIFTYNNFLHKKKQSFTKMRPDEALKIIICNDKPYKVWEVLIKIWCKRLVFSRL